jgi:hypothetical protein
MRERAQDQCKQKATLTNVLPSADFAKYTKTKAHKAGASKKATLTNALLSADFAKHTVDL